MTSDLLFSILPREGKVPISHDTQKVLKIDKQEALRALSDEEKELKGEEREARQKQQKHDDSEQGSEDEVKSENAEADNTDTESKQHKGPKHLDIYV